MRVRPQALEHVFVCRTGNRASSIVAGRQSRAGVGWEPDDVKGHIRRRHSSWYIVYNEPQGDDGKTKQRWRGGFRTKREAEDALGLLQHALNPRGRPPRTDDEYQRIARIYLAKLAQRAETNRTPMGVAAEIAAEEGIPASTLRGWLYGARQRGFLSKAIPGRPGATPGPKLGP